MILFRTLAVTLLTGALLIAQAGAAFSLPRTHVSSQTVRLAQAAPDTEGQDEQNDEPQARDRGVLRGSIVAVDYARGILRVQTPHRGRIDVQILPSTNIVRRGDEYGTIADLTPGVRISANVSEVGGLLVAQIIRIL